MKHIFSLSFIFFQIVAMSGYVMAQDSIGFVPSKVTEKNSSFELTGMALQELIIGIDNYEFQFSEGDYQLLKELQNKSQETIIEVALESMARYISYCRTNIEGLSPNEIDINRIKDDLDILTQLQFDSYIEHYASDLENLSFEGKEILENFILPRILSQKDSIEQLDIRELARIDEDTLRNDLVNGCQRAVSSKPEDLVIIDVR